MSATDRWFQAYRSAHPDSNADQALAAYTEIYGTRLIERPWHERFHIVTILRIIVKTIRTLRILT